MPSSCPPNALSPCVSPVGRLGSAMMRKPAHLAASSAAWLSSAPVPEPPCRATERRGEAHRLCTRRLAPGKAANSVYVGWSTCAHAISPTLGGQARAPGDFPCRPWHLAPLFRAQLALGRCVARSPRRAHPSNARRGSFPELRGSTATSSGCKRPAMGKAGGVHATIACLSATIAGVPRCVLGVRRERRRGRRAQPTAVVGSPSRQGGERLVHLVWQRSRGRALASPSRDPTLTPR